MLVCGEKNILSNLTNSQEPEPGAFGSLEPEPLEKKNQEPEPEPLGKKIRSQSRSRLKKKSGTGAGAAKKFAGSPALVCTQSADPISFLGTHCMQTFQRDNSQPILTFYHFTL